MNDNQQKVAELIALAHAVFDFDDWRVLVMRRCVVIYPSARPNQRLVYDSLQDAVDDMRFRRLVRFTPFKDYV